MSRSDFARALFAAAALYRCGDEQGLGRAILTRYLDDWRGVFVRYAGHTLGLKDECVH